MNLKAVHCVYENWLYERVCVCVCRYISSMVFYNKRYIWMLVYTVTEHGREREKYKIKSAKVYVYLCLSWESTMQSFKIIDTQVRKEKQ